MRNLTFTVLAATVATTASIYAFLPSTAEAQEVMLYKNPQCGCCESYADYLRQNGFTVTVEPTHQLASMSREAGVPDDVQGCHLSIIEGYAVSGHVPVATVSKLLTGRPDIKGVTLPGMPLGSPGMGGAKERPFEILEISKSGTVAGIYARE
ncbi:DUF411 domain-containing protein [Neoaquamicrobium sediminum]|uniref:DUF411 domain-containing protein n=1 Tax=Neoaquamicrobium sediminum TaxID=1849104 RepID=A0ABV3X0G5_9HYPH|nr:DUF411 domain-containing protein [Mesorhizobium sediminum]NRC56490.1 DUF411 domain-containing protein [Mesorhizobium sediminum]